MTTRATVGREESPSVSSPQRPTCSRRRPYIPAAVPAKYSSKNKLHLCRICGNLFFCRLLNGSACCFRQARCYRHFTCRRRLPLAARSTFLGSRDCFGHKFCRSAVADNTLTIKQKSILPVSKTRQDKSLFCSLSGAYLPPLESGSVVLLCSHLAIMDFRRTCATTIRYRLPLAPVIRST